MCLVAIIVSCFRIIGRRIHFEENKSPAGFLIWAIGVSLFAHCLSFMSITYFDQTIIIWYWLLAVISSLDCFYLTEAPGDVSARPSVPMASEPLENSAFHSSWKPSGA